MNANTAAISQGYVTGVIQGFNRNLQTDALQMSMRSVAGPRPRRGFAFLHPTFLFNPGLVSSWFLVTGLFGQLLLMNGMITASTTMVKEREAGTLEQLLMTPVRISEIIVAKIVPPFVLLGIPVTIALLVIRLYFKVPFNGSATMLAVASAACLLGAIGLGTAVATLTKSAQQAQLASFFIMPPLVSLSGALTPAEAMPAWLRPLTAINPVYHFGVISRGALIRGGGFQEMWPNLLALCLFALVLMSISVWRFRQQLN
jgi:ABC-2 type transport system permease protein